MLLVSLHLKHRKPSVLLLMITLGDVVVRQDCVRFPDPASGPLRTRISESVNASQPETA